MPQEPDQFIGQALGQYQILDILGKGGMATVYRAYQRSVDREVAIKVLSPDLASDERLLARFEREARMVASLQHPHILTVHDFGREGRTLYLVMRLMMGGNLLDELRANSPLSTGRTLKLVSQIADALDYAHERGIVHRDLKPSNVLLDEDGNVCLTDFGIAKMLQGGATTGLTSPNAMMGTPVYMAPEQWRSEPVSPRTDIYALGVMAYWMVVGQAPFSAETPHGLMYQHLNEQPEPPQYLNPDVPGAIAPVLARALAKRPEERFETAGAFAASLARAYRPPSAPGYRTGYSVPGPQPDRTMQRPRPPQPSPPPSQYDRTRPPSQYDRTRPPSQYGAPSQYGDAFNDDRPRATHTPLTSTGYTPPHVTGSHDSRFGDRHPERVRDALYDDDPGIGRFLWVIGGVSLVVIIGLALALVIGLLATGGRDEPDSGPDDSAPAATGVPDNLRPRVAIQQPANQAAVGLGQPVPVEFVAQGEGGVTRVELRRFNQVIATVDVPGAPRYQGVFIYTPDSTGPHNLEVVPWNGNIAGEPDRVTIFVQ